MTDRAARAVDELGDAFLSGDTDAVLALFADVGEVVYAGSEPGEVAVGKNAIKALLDELFARDERYSWRATSVVTLENGGRWYVVAECVLTVHPSGEQVPYRVTGVLEYEGAAWRWRLCQGSEPAQG
jgi:ketosteroid isomerase-like protein